MHQMGYASLFDIQQTDASTYKIPLHVNVIYLFNPFGEGTMKKVIENIVAHVNNCMISIHVIYCMPSYQYLFNIYAECTKVYERLNKSKTYAEIAVYKISPK